MSDVAQCCHEPLISIRFRLDANGRTLYQRQCSNCSSKIGQFLSRREVEKTTSLDDVYPWDNRYEPSDPAQAKAQEWNEKRKTYKNYLNSAAWSDTRAKVMRRANYVCEGCLSLPAVHVHHLTYAHVGRELMWELRAVCHACHERAHDGKKQTFGSKS